MTSNVVRCSDVKYISSKYVYISSFSIRCDKSFLHAALIQYHCVPTDEGNWSYPRQDGGNHVVDSVVNMLISIDLDCHAFL